jgi:hypothetical protein
VEKAARQPSKAFLTYWRHHRKVQGIFAAGVIALIRRESLHRLA